MGRLTDERPRLQTGPGKFGRPALSGGLRKRSPGGNEIPTRNRKSGLGNPPPTAGASEFYPNQNGRSRDSECNRLFSSVYFVIVGPCRFYRTVTRYIPMLSGKSHPNMNTCKNQP